MVYTGVTSVHDACCIRGACTSQGHEHEDHVDCEPDGHGHEETYIEILEEVNDIAHELLMLDLGDVVDERLQRIRTLATTRPGDGYRRRHRRRMDGGEGPSS